MKIRMRRQNGQKAAKMGEKGENCKHLIYRESVVGSFLQFFFGPNSHWGPRKQLDQQTAIQGKRDLQPI